MKPYLFLDLDEMMFATLQHMVDYINKRHGINSTIHDHIGQNDTLDSVIKRYNKDYNLSWGETYMDVGINFHASLEIHKNVLPMEGMPEAVKQLSKKYRLVVVTARQKAGYEVIRYLLNKHVPGCITHIHCVWEHIGNGRFNEIMSKRKFIESVSGKKTGFIDDSVHEIKKLMSVLDCYLFDPTNLHESVPGIPNRVHGWDHIHNTFLR
jgi:5'(3')-deoxyribonucleotidase